MGLQGDDALLHQRVVSGDESALAELYDRFSPLVFGLCVRVTRDRTIAEDITQEVFLTFWERPLAFDPERGTLRAWLATIAHRRAVDHVRAEERKKPSHLGPRLFEREPAPMEDSVLDAEASARVRHAVQSLPAEQREALEMAYWGGRTYRQVAERLGLPEGTVKSRIRQALRQLAGMLAEEGVR
ncbi:RNA polymerase sigma factor [Actinomadura rudentiformis]|uniref:Sigma-70 family RNA polymerase sigma factor n=1 Tax=Actinomadura rudentiformis TaxID=359158 RepID=A0A6H9YSL9_9ACTN|nr:sigma-70 family RNA polymerase sigma factor [Actinomadura rudentiformis]KAB2347018.1 sigma-70 family RNA polymerase sigma factor [Actinomadura rudentiformis]